MNPLKLLITDTSLLITEKGKTLFQNSFSSDEECFNTIQSTLKNNKNKDIHCLIAGRRIISKTVIIHYTSKELFTADKNLLERLIENARHSFLLEHKDTPLELVGSSLLTTSLNGYPVSKLKKDKVSDITVTVAFFALSAVYRKKLLEALTKTKRATLSIESFAPTLIEKVRKHSKKEEFIICSAYERSTDISIRKSSGYFETITIPLGTHHVVDTSVTAFQASFESEVMKALTGLSDGLTLPSDVYLLVSPEFKDAYSNAFRTDSYHSLSFSDKGFEVTDMSSILTI